MVYNELFLEFAKVLETAAALARKLAEERAAQVAEPTVPEPPTQETDAAKLAAPSLTEVQEALVDYARAFGADAARAVLGEFGARNLREVPPERLDELFVRLRIRGVR